MLTCYWKGHALSNSRLIDMPTFGGVSMSGILGHRDFYLKPAASTGHICNRISTFFHIAVQHYSRDLLSFIFMMLTAVNMWKALRTYDKGPDLLNRQQTDEWKGWMQVTKLACTSVLSSPAGFCRKERLDSEVVQPYREPEAFKIRGQ